MPGKIRVRIISARNLPIMDRSSDSTDAFVEVRFGENLYEKTEVYKKSLDPEWNARFIFEVEEDEIQEEPLQIRVLDHDTYTSHDAIGKVYIDLKPLLNKNGPSSISGWFPIYDTMHGIRGEIQIQIKLELLSDCNAYKKSSSGVQFFSSSKIPEGYILQTICGFVEELVINDDPEYKLIDKIRAPRTSNEARQKLFSQLSGELQRRIGLKVLDMNANCVLGYIQYFDLEGEHGIVVRGIGTAAVISKQTYLSPNASVSPHNILQHTVSVTTPPSHEYQHLTANINLKTKKPSPNRLLPVNNSAGNNILLQRVHSDPNLSSTMSSNQPISLHSGVPEKKRTFLQNKGWELNAPATATAQQQLQPSAMLLKQQQSSVLDKMEYPFLTLQQYPTGFIKTVCGVVCARSVKLQTSATITANSSDTIDLRDKWWIEIRNEIRSQMKAFNCHVVLGYTETKSICDDLNVLSAMGTAAIIDEKFFHLATVQQQQVQSQQGQQLNVNTNFDYMYNHDYVNNFTDLSNKTCSICHLIPSTVSTALNPQASAASDGNQTSALQQQENEVDVETPQPSTTVASTSCAQCQQGQVPNVLFLTIQPIPELLTVGKGCFIKALVTRSLKKTSGEITARIISDCLPFIEYELHRQLLNKLKLNGMNTLYGLKSQISIGENLIIGIAEATACFTACLPQSQLVKLVSTTNIKANNELDDINKLLKESLLSNIEFFQINNESVSHVLESVESIGNGSAATALTINEIEQQFENANHIKIDLDDFYEKENLDLLLNRILKHKKGFYNCSTQYMPGLVTSLKSNLQTFVRVFRCETSLGQLHTKEFNNIVDRILLSLRYKFRYYKNCCLTNLAFDISLYDDDHAMIIVTGNCLVYDLKQSSLMIGNNGENSDGKKNGGTKAATENKNCEITTLNYVPNTVIERYLGYINLFLIRESTSIKESGGLNGFMNSFICEMLSLTRAHVLSLGGNSLVSFKLNECFLIDNPHKNLGQCLINIAGDVVQTNTITV